MTFVHPLVLLALLGIPLLAWWYAGQQRHREQAASAFVVPALIPSVAPRRPRSRRHIPMLLFALALAVLIVAAARPQRSVAEPVTDGAIMLADDVVELDERHRRRSLARGGSAPRREPAFLARVPSAVEVGLLAFARTPIVLQSPTS